MSAPLQLVERCEQATGPDRELDCAIWWETDRSAFTNRYWQGALGLPRELAEMPKLDGIGGLGVKVSAPPFTASLDAAMTLVPEGYLWGCGNDAGEPGGWPWAWCDESDELPGDYLTFAATPALALCAAALRARGETA